MEEKIKEIISVFTKIPVEQIGPATAIGRSAMQSSILLHRMYARLSDVGVMVDNYADIATLGDLLQRRSDKEEAASPSSFAVSSSSFSASGIMDSSAAGIGIDIEEIAGLPRTHDFRKEEFYRMNFTAAEIAYCVLQPDPYASFTGLFAAKEAIIKADGRYRNKLFNAIPIGHSAEGKPLFAGFDLSISHAGTMAVAVAVSSAGGAVAVREDAASVGSVMVPAAGSKGRLAFWLAGLALVVSVLTLLVVLTHWHE